MIEECKAGLTDIVVVKSISRLGRDTVEVLDAINTLRESQVRIIFKQEELDTLKVGSSLLISPLKLALRLKIKHEVLILNGISNKEPRMVA